MKTLKIGHFTHLCPLLALIVPLSVRTIPEIILGPHIAGFDPLGFYIPVVFALEKESTPWQYIAIAPLFYLILMQTKIIGIPLTLTLKILPPILHGFLGFAIYLYASAELRWSHEKSLSAALLGTLYFMALRVSWDMHRTQLGLAFLFIALATLPKEESRWRDLFLSALTMTLVVLANHFIAVIMLIIVLTTLTQVLIKHKKAETRNLIIVSTPPSLLFLTTLYAFFEEQSHVVSSLLFPPEWHQLFDCGSYLNSAINMVSLFIYCYLPLLPVAIKGVGFLKNLQIKSWILWSLAASLLPTISFSIQYRWIMTLTYPLTFYTIESLTKVEPKPKQIRMSKIFGTIITVLAMGFIVMPAEMPFPYFGIPHFQLYVPSTMLQNTIPQRDFQDTVNTLNWLKNQMNENSCLITHQAFYGWALLNLNNASQILNYGYGDPQKAAVNAAQQGYDHIYLIWWVNGYGWHGQPNVPTSFKEVYRSNKIAVYEKESV